MSKHMHPWHDVELPHALDAPIPVIVESPMGSRVKCKVDKATGLLIVDGILLSAERYPANYGFVPRTYCEDGDPLDILVYCQVPIEPLAIVRARVIGVIKMRDDRGDDDTLISAHSDDPEYAFVSDIQDLPALRLRGLRRFLQDYEALEKSKEVSMWELQGRNEGLRILEDAILRYRQERPRLLPPPDRGPTSVPSDRATRGAAHRAH
ncbi:MAG TPA: inorganic diphosphatase [Anaeromyxobacteraceae bacterium]|nr:inorganic diphosphatase [Anaeromyxobacteraceae bacterium]